MRGCYHLVKIFDMKKTLGFDGVLTITRPCRTTRVSACRNYVQLLLGVGFGGVKDCSIHEQSGEVCLTKTLGLVRFDERQ